MPLKVTRVFISFLFILSITAVALAQGEPERTTLAELKADPPRTPTSAEIMRSRISKAKAYLVVKNYGAAIYELENIRRETRDPAVHNVLNVLLMHAYLEQGDYVKAQKFLKDVHASKSPTAAMEYLAVAGQVVSGAKTLFERYRSLGLDVSDRNLPTEASTDVENMRQTLELVIEQSKDLSRNKEYAANAFALLEESSSARGNLAKDVYDQKRWKNEVADAREQLVNPNTKIINATGRAPIQAPNPDIVATIPNSEEKTTAETPAELENGDGETAATEETDEVETAIFKAVEEEVKETPAVEQPRRSEPVRTPAGADTARNEPAKNEPEKKDSGEADVMPRDRKVVIIGSAERNDDEKSAPKENRPNVRSTIEEKPREEKRPAERTVARDEPAESEEKPAVDPASPLTVGSLIGYATKRVNPIYPSQARTMRMTGTVTVKLTIDEDGRVASIEDTDGPALLIRAASDAVRKWEFKPFTRDGRPVKATGFISFNFNL